MSYSIKKQLKSKAGKKSLYFAVAGFALIFLLLGQFPYKVTRNVSADTQLGQRPRGVRTAHLGSDPVAGRKDYIIREQTTGNQTTITVYAPGGTLLFSIPPDPTQPIQELIDVVDMDGDGSAEIIGIHGGNGSNVAPVLYIYDGFGNLRTRFGFLPGTTLGYSGIKIYNLWPNSNQNRIVAVPNTDTGNYIGIANNAFVYFFDSNGNILATPSVPEGTIGSWLDFPGVVVGDINNSGGHEIFVIAKARFLAFNQHGQKLYYKQFVDPNGSFTSYEPGIDKPSGSNLSWNGRRYGLYQLIDVDGNGDLELIMAADKNNINNNLAGAVYEAYNISASAQPDGYIGNIRMWRAWVMNSTMDALITINNPQGYKVGVPLLGIADVNGDGILDIVLTEKNSSGNPVVRVINARTGAITGALFNGICLDVQQLDVSQSLPDLIVYDPTTINPVTGLGTHMVWRFNQGTYTPLRLSENPAGTLTSGAAILVEEAKPDNVAIATTLSTGVNTGEGHFSCEQTRSGGVKAFVGYSSLGCPSGLFSWITTGGIIQRSLNLASRPGRVVDIRKVDDTNNRVWMLNLESSCSATDVVRTVVQSGSNLVANGDL